MLTKTMTMTLTMTMNQGTRAICCGPLFIAPPPTPDACRRANPAAAAAAAAMPPAPLQQPMGTPPFDAIRPSAARRPKRMR